MAAARPQANARHPSSDTPACGWVWGDPMGSWHGVLWRGSPGSTAAPALLGGLLCVSPCKGTQDTMQLGACTNREHVSTWMHILGGRWAMHTQSQGCWAHHQAGAPVPALCLPHVRPWGAARMMAPPASMALATAQHGRVLSVGTRDRDQTNRARGHLAQPQPPA